MQFHEVKVVGRHPGLLIGLPSRVAGQHVLVNGVEIVRGTEVLDARPGTLLRSGRDTETVTASV